ncbi:hypothetical protein CTI12_AA025310 [Artemisia annua]|uniref:DUF2921 domain-containing protein n=1 Tax=Artemisia annua TaxID=35608 RepID=A0A2U1QIP3_ARTAN|nr:hypothetical protein CTI12_AA025310 [Artemisia annua]
MEITETCPIWFLNSSYVRGWPVNPYTSLVAEWVWDQDKKRLMLVPCKLFDRRDVGGCSIRLALSLPSRFSLIHRGSIVGKMWSTDNQT